jgi:RHS repeat-associated protein
MTVKQYVWDQDNILYETDGNDAVNAEYTYSPEQYGELISEYRDGETYTHYYDAQGSTLAMTDETGHVTDRFTYNAWGEEVARTGTTKTPWKWVGAVGAYFDPVNAYQIRRRGYQPVIGRWASSDPVGFVVDYNVFRYVSNSPIVYSDPSGLCKVCLFMPIFDRKFSSLEPFGRFLPGQRPYSRPMRAWRDAHAKHATEDFWPPAGTYFADLDIQGTGKYEWWNSEHYNKWKPYEARYAFYLFFIAADVCDAPTCRVKVTEQQTKTEFFFLDTGRWHPDNRFNDNAPKVKVDVIPAPSDGAISTDTMRATYKTPVSECTDHIVSADAPSDFLGNFREAVARRRTVRQLTDIIDATTGLSVGSIEIEFTIGYSAPRKKRDNTWELGSSQHFSFEWKLISHTKPVVDPD